MVSSFATGGPVGPMLALLNVQSIMMTIIQAVRTATLPNYLQLIGLAFGTIGGLILTVPDFVKRIFCCK